VCNEIIGPWTGIGEVLLKDVSAGRPFRLDDVPNDPTLEVVRDTFLAQYPDLPTEPPLSLSIVASSTL
jgi:hypothetical protein